MKHLPSKDEMYRAVRSSDSSYDGIFFVAVRTTGVFCRPSCPAKKPLARNVEYFQAARDALFAGYRACKRCRPLDTSGRAPSWVRQLLTRVEQEPQERLADADLRSMSIDPARARRYFQENYGMTFQAYQRARRLGEALSSIREGGRLSHVAVSHGYQSESGFRDAFGKAFGKSPGRSRGEPVVTTAMLESPLGPLLTGATDEGLCLLEFCDRRALEAQIATLRRRFAVPLVPGKHKWLTRVGDELARYFDRKLKAFSVPIVYPGTAFQQRVWSELLRIPYGETISYEVLAKRVGSSGAQRAVGTANGANRIAIIIPCHRVVNKDGRLGGYGGGLWRKQYLLELEQAVVAGQHGLRLEPSLARG